MGAMGDTGGTGSQVREGHRGTGPGAITPDGCAVELYARLPVGEEPDIIERAMALLRAGSSVTDACMEVGCTSLGSFSTRFTELVGETPSAYRAREHDAVAAMPACVAKVRTRPTRDTVTRDTVTRDTATRDTPSRIREAGREAAA